MKKSESERLVRVETKMVGLEKKMDTVCIDVKKILTNHLPHIKTEISNLRTDIAVSKVKVGLITGTVAIIVATVITFLVTKLLEAV